MALKFLDSSGLKYLLSKIKNLLSGKADKSTTLSGYGITNAYTKTETDTAINNAKYTLPNATSSVLGGVKVGTNISVSSGTISVANGSTSAKGVVQLTNSTSSTSTTTAATPNSVKSAYDLANSKQSPATTLSGYGIADAYTKTQVDTAVNGAKYTHPNSGVTAGTYRSVTVNAQGHITSGSNPTITIAQGGTGATNEEGARQNLEVSVKTYTTYAQIGLSSAPTTMLELVRAVPAHSIFMREVSTSYESLGMPFMGLLIINKGNYGNVSMWNYRQGGANIVHHKVAFCNWSEGQTAFKWGILPCLENGVLQIEDGGTGATTAQGVLTNLGLTATTTELNYCDGVTSNIQTQLNALAKRIADLEAIIPSEFATVATTGSYKDLVDLPTKIKDIKDY